MQSTVSPDTARGAGFERTRIRQFTVFLENKVGRLQMLARTFEESSTRIVALSVAETSDAAMVRVICTDQEVGRIALRKRELYFAETDVLCVELPRSTKAPLMSVCMALLAAEISIHYAYPLLVRPRGPALAFYVDDPTLAVDLLFAKNYNLLGESDLKAL